MNLGNFQNITDKEYSSLNSFILDNSKLNKFNNTHFEIKGIIEKANPKFEESAQLLIKNELSKNVSFIQLNCSILNEENNYYNILCLIKEKAVFIIQGLVAFSGNNLILINSENDKIAFNNTELNNQDLNQNKYFNTNKKSSSKIWILAIIIPIVVLVIVLVIIFIIVIRKKKVNDLFQSDTEINMNQFNN